MGKSTKPYWRGNIKCLKLAAGMGAAGRGSLTASHLFFIIIIIFTHKGSVPLKKKKYFLLFWTFLSQKKAII